VETSERRPISESAQIVAVGGGIVAVMPDADDSECVRLVLVAALGPPPGRSSDRRKMQLICPRDMRLATAEPHNIDLPPPPLTSA
jgi:hypothetical protein